MEKTNEMIFLLCEFLLGNKKKNFDFKLKDLVLQQNIDLGGFEDFKVELVQLLYQCYLIGGNLNYKHYIEQIHEKAINENQMKLFMLTNSLKDLIRLDSFSLLK